MSTYERKVRPALWAVVAVGVALVAGWFVWATAAILEQSETNGAIAKDARETAERLKDCVEPTGRCFAEGQERTGEAVAGINAAALRITVAVAVCQTRFEDPDRLSEIARCAEGLLAAQEQSSELEERLQGQ